MRVPLGCRVALLLAIPLAAAVTSCGTPAGQQLSPEQRAAAAKQAVLSAAHATASQAFRADLTLSETFHATGPAAGQLASLEGKPIDLSIHVEQQSAQRALARVRAVLAGHSVDVVAVLLGSSAYVSSDGGHTFSRVPLNSAAVSQYGSQQAVQYLNSVGTVTDTGPGSVHGTNVEKYHATLDPAKMAAALQTALSSFKGTALSTALTSLRFTGGFLNAGVDAHNHLVTEDGSIDASIDLGSVGRQFAGTVLQFHITLGGYFYDYGAAVSVTPPAGLSAA